MGINQLKPTVEMTENESRAAQNSNNGYLLMASSLPITSIIWLPIATVPTGFKACNGAAILISTVTDFTTAFYCGDVKNPTALYGYKCTNPASPNTSRSLIGTYIVLPDLRGEFIRAWDDARGVDVGRALGTWQADDFKSHSHPYTLGNIPIENGGATSDGFQVANSGTTKLGTGNKIGLTGGTETRPRNISLMPIIKVTGFLDSASVFYTKAQIDTYLSDKVDKVTGSSLITTVEKNQIATNTTNIGTLTTGLANVYTKSLTYTKTETDNAISQVVSSLEWKPALDSFDFIEATYPTPIDGWTVNVQDTDITYRFSGTAWIAISANAIPLATSSVDGKMSKEDKAKMDGLAVVATTGSYNNLIDKPSIPTQYTDVMADVRANSAVGVHDTSGTAHSTILALKANLIGGYIPISELPLTLSVGNRLITI